jgi:hypothetical protein
LCEAPLGPYRQEVPAPLFRRSRLFRGGCKGMASLRSSARCEGIPGPPASATGIDTPDGPSRPWTRSARATTSGSRCGTCPSLPCRSLRLAEGCNTASGIGPTLRLQSDTSLHAVLILGWQLANGPVRAPPKWALVRLSAARDSIDSIVLRSIRPTRAKPPFDASVDLTEARDVRVLSRIAAPVDAARTADGTRDLASKSAHDPHRGAFLLGRAPRGLLRRTGLMFDV